MKKRNLLKKLASAAMAAVLTVSTMTAASAATVADFKDVKPGAWYYNAVQYSSANNLFAGTSPTTFSPDAAVTRGMFVTVLGKMSKINTSDYLNNRYTDVNSTAYYAPYIEWATTYGIVSGTGNNKFEPEEKITRQQMATILYNYADVAGNDTSVEWGGTGFLWYGYKNWYFADGKQADWYAHDALEWCVEHGILAGSNGKLSPKATATRSECAQILYNARDKMTVCTDWTARYDADGHYDPNGNYDANGWLRYLPNGEPVSEKNVERYLTSLQSKYPEGMQWSEDTNGKVCQDYVDEIYDIMNVIETNYINADEIKANLNLIKPGDALAYKTTANTNHILIVWSVTTDGAGNLVSIQTTEGNYGGTVHWGKTMTREELSSAELHFMYSFY